MSSITITWTYPPDAQHASHTADPILVSALKERDPTETLIGENLNSKKKRVAIPFFTNLRRKSRQQPT